MPEEEDGLRTTALVTIAVVAAAGALYLARVFFGPIAIATFLAITLRPIVRTLERLRIPAFVSSAMIVLVLMAGLFVFGKILAGPVEEWVMTAPQSLEAAKEKINRIRQPVQKVSEAINKATSVPSTQHAAPPPAVQPPDYLATLFGTTSLALAGLAEVLLLLFLLLGSGNLFFIKLIHLFPHRAEKQTVRQIVEEVEQSIMHYLVTAAMIFAGQGVIIGLVMMFWGVPHPVLWGCLTFVLEFIPYLGATIMIILLTLTSLATFDTLGHIIAPGLSYLVIGTLQNSIVSPYAYGKRLRLNPVAVLIGVLGMWFLWGIPGAFVAVPILRTIKIVSEQTEKLAAVGEFLGE